MHTRLVLAVGATALAASAQVMTWVSQGGVNASAPGPGNVVYFGAEFAGSSKVVKGAPYSAQVVTEHTQTLADGNTINQKQSGALYRDSEGRTRREQALGPIGPVPADANAPQLVFINDPVAGVSYVLDARKKTAQKLPLGPPPPPGAASADMMPPPGPIVAAGVPHDAEGQVRINVRTSAVRLGGTTVSQPATQESLGSKVVEGVQAEGTRTTMTIPAGQIGNARPIETVTERWYSPQLQVTVLSTTSDPMVGQTSYRLTNISLAEPPASLFEIPSDYTVTEGPAKGQVMYMQKVAK
jgi:hypothetical protein